MFASLQRAAQRKGIAAALAASVAVAGIGVAVARPSGPPAPAEASATVAAGSTSGLEAVVDQAKTSAGEGPAPAAGVQQEVAIGETTTTSATTATSSSAAASTVDPSGPSFEPEQFLPEGFDAGDLKGLLAEGFSPEVAEGVEELASGVIARIEACVGDIFGDFGSDFDFGSGWDFGSDFDFGSGFDRGGAMASDLVSDVLPCVQGLVDDSLSCVNGLVEEILAVVMSMDIEEIVGLVEVIVDELVACAEGATTG